MTVFEAAAQMGRKGGKVRTPKGFAALTPAQRSEIGKAAAAKRSAALTPERRSEIAKAAAAKRWSHKTNQRPA